DDLNSGPLEALTDISVRRSPPDTVSWAGTTAAHLVEMVVGLPALKTMTVSFDGYSQPPVELTHDEVTDGFDDPLGTRFALFDGTRNPEVHFIRPMRAGDSIARRVDP